MIILSQFDHRYKSVLSHDEQIRLDNVLSCLQSHENDVVTVLNDLKCGRFAVCSPTTVLNDENINPTPEVIVALVHEAFHSDPVYKPVALELVSILQKYRASSPLPGNLLLDV